LADIKKPEIFFPGLWEFEQSKIFEDVERPWDALPKIRDYILKFLAHKTASQNLPDGLEHLKGEGTNADWLYCSKPLLLVEDLYCRDLEIFIGAGTKIEPTAIINDFSVIGTNCEIRHSAYLRGDLICGNHCTLGHSSEIKGSIIMNHTEMGHFNYIGDSVLGSFVNIGAGTKLANLKFRTPEAKIEVSFPEITFMLDGEKVSTGLSKFGAIIGDYSETGCNSVLSPAVMLGTECWVYPNFTVPSGQYEPKTFLAPDNFDVKKRHLPK